MTMELKPLGFLVLVRWSAITEWHSLTDIHGQLSAYRKRKDAEHVARHHREYQGRGTAKVVPIAAWNQRKEP